MASLMFLPDSMRSFTPKVTKRLASTLVWPLKNLESAPLHREWRPKRADRSNSGVYNSSFVPSALIRWYSASIRSYRSERVGKSVGPSKEKSVLSLSPHLEYNRPSMISIVSIWPSSKGL